MIFSIEKRYIYKIRNFKLQLMTLYLKVSDIPLNTLSEKYLLSSPAGKHWDRQHSTCRVSTAPSLLFPIKRKEAPKPQAGSGDFLYGKQNPLGLVKSSGTREQHAWILTENFKM